jgi:hypothetical protein
VAHSDSTCLNLEAFRDNSLKEMSMALQTQTIATCEVEVKKANSPRMNDVM